jgi:hypothetical protein
MDAKPFPIWLDSLKKYHMGAKPFQIRFKVSWRHPGDTPWRHPSGVMAPETNVTHSHTLTIRPPDDTYVTLGVSLETPLGCHLGCHDTQDQCHTLTTIHPIDSSIR